ncbi:hypothetical protein I7I51_00413 [Histoplasma capsulatum]|uniref:Uncharacterized protein n=1 Tax=Ajellomyces capsulatus TaxID=5037 RepID=A0A8A1MBZ4_AJECA|nr:predicted protein [Histoplasma mississippiense (nom. inval.)]EDN08761.1 predicted protein [Histoplasma mississippiense (nom. inval.)]QSS63355.1 hypothetical protein I7I51_00413 [Histoplasma capsulatum]
MGLFEKLHAKLELYRLEQRYARRKHRSTLTMGAQYVDGEYVYTNNTGSGYSSAANSSSTVAKHSTGTSWRPSGNWGGFGSLDRRNR